MQQRTEKRIDAWGQSRNGAKLSKVWVTFQDEYRAFLKRHNVSNKGFALQGRKIAAVVTGVEYCMKGPFLLRPYRALRHGGKFPALKRRAEPGSPCGA
jgi:hypothetical protein